MNDYKVVRITTNYKYEVVVVSAYDEDEASEKACARGNWSDLSTKQLVNLKVSLYENEKSHTER